MGLVRHDINITEIQGSPEEIILDKCKKAFEIIEKTVLVEDVSLFFMSWNGLHGPYVKYFSN